MNVNASVREENREQIVWINVIMLSVLHMIAIFGLYIWLIAWKCQMYTFIFHFLWAIAASFGITGGAHRLWCHRSYKANRRLKILFAILTSMIFANDIYTWVRDHRAHHKFVETDADPHNIRRGLFFAHCGWLLVRKHPEVHLRGATISCADLDADDVVTFHRKYYAACLMPLGTFLLPTMIPACCWGQQHAFALCVLRYVLNIHLVWSLNSFAHSTGTKPYDKRIHAVENEVMMYTTLGEGFHNYHHVFPWDYRAAEFGDDARNLTTWLIHCFVRIGWASELKMASPDVIASRALRTGDGSWKRPKGMPRSKKSCAEEGNSEHVWGWDDPDVTITTKQTALILP